MEDGSGASAASISESANGIRAALFKEIREGREKRQAEMRNQEIGSDGRERPQDMSAQEVLITEGHNLNPNPVDNPDAFDRQLNEYNRISSEQTQEHTHIEANENQDTGQNLAQADDEERRSRDDMALAIEMNATVAPESIPIEAAGTPEYAVHDHSDMSASEIVIASQDNPIPQEARDTPHEPLDPANPPPHIRGVIPPGEWVPEPQNIPGPPNPEPE